MGHVVGGLGELFKGDERLGRVTYQVTAQEPIASGGLMRLSGLVRTGEIDFVTRMQGADNAARLTLVLANGSRWDCYAQQASPLNPRTTTLVSASALYRLVSGEREDIVQTRG